MLFNQTWKPILVSHWLEKQHSDRTPTHHIQEDVYESYTLYFRIDNSGSNWKDFSHVAKILNHLKSWWEDLKLDQRACRRFTHSRNALSGFHRQKGINNPVRAITGVRHSCYSSLTFLHPKLVKDGVEWLPPKQRPPAHTADYSKSQNIAKWLAMKPQRWGVFSPSSKNPLSIRYYPYHRQDFLCLVKLSYCWSDVTHPSFSAPTFHSGSKQHHFHLYLMRK